MEKKIVTLAELKGEKVRLRNTIERKAGNLKTVRDYLAVKRKVKELESMLLWTILSLILMLSGCKAGVGIGMDVSAYYPEIETAKGGKFGDPAPSRKQSTQHTTGMARNNLPMIGGAK